MISRWATLTRQTLAKQMTRWKRRYSRSLHRFEHRNVIVFGDRQSNGWYIAACAYCSDSTVTGLSGDTVTFFRVERIQSCREAWDLLTDEVATAALLYPETAFYGRARVPQGRP